MFVYTKLPFIVYRGGERAEFPTDAAAHVEYRRLCACGQGAGIRLVDGQGYYAPDLIQEAQALVSCLAEKYLDASGPRRLKTRRILNKSKRRLNRRRSAAGKHVPIRGLEGLINSLEADWF